MNNARDVQQLVFTATCASGLETLVEDEIKSFKGTVISSGFGGVVFSGSLETAYRACLWSRYSNHILLTILESTVQDADDLYKAALNVKWRDYFENNQTFAVDAVLINSTITHTHFASLRVKDAVVDWFRDNTGKRPSVVVNRPDILIHVYVYESKAVLSIDLSGESLHMRGYRIAGGEAPLKESLAAALVKLSGWMDKTSADILLLDPMCGSGTLLIEAALLFGDIAPGLGRNYYGFLRWKGHREDVWKDLLTEAEEKRKNNLAMKWPRIIGFDASRQAVRGAIANIEKAGLRGIVHVERQELADLQCLCDDKKNIASTRGHIIVNPPYGERLGTLSAVRYLYRCLGYKLKEQYAGWKAGVFTNHVELADALGLGLTKKYRLYNGQIPCHLYLYDIPPPGQRAEQPHAKKTTETVSSHEADDFKNRLVKNLKKITPWAQRTGISCYRIYDADIPEYNIAVDVYEDWLHVQEYAPPKTIDPSNAAKNMNDALHVIRDVLGVRKNQVFIKVRQRQKGNTQYQKKYENGRLYEVMEGGCRFLVNLTDYLDTGLFLDHRITRKMLFKEAAEARFLNLFGYTGTATVYAAMGGAVTSVTVDRSPVYLEWARSNMALNGFSDENHTMVRADCMEWLSKTNSQFNLIFVDPPTFSNTSSRKDVFDIQRDHVTLIKRAMKRLDPEGLMIFSTNFRRFTMDMTALSKFEIIDISSATIPKDFERTPRIHQCWRIRHRTA